MTGGTDSQCSQPDQEVEYDLDKPRIAPNEHTWRSHDTVFWYNSHLAQRGIAILSNSIARNHSFRHTTSDLYRQSGLHENKGRTLLQNMLVTKVTTSDTCAELATRSKGCTCFRIEKIR